MKFLRDLRVILGILLIIVLIVATFVVLMLKKQNTKIVEEKDTEISELQSQLSNIGDMTTVYTLASDVVAGKTVEDNDLVTVEIPTSSAANVIGDIDSFRQELIGDAVNKSLVYKLDLTTGTILTKEMLADYTLTDDLRYYDIVLNQYFIGMQQGSYFDIRYAASSGEDSIVVSHVRAEQVNTGIPKVVMSEKDILTYRSALIESVLDNGFLYAVEYVESGLQKPADSFYIAKPYLLSLINDTSLEADIKASLMQNAGHGIYDEDEDKQKEIRERILEKFNSNGSTITSAQTTWQEEELRKAEEAAEAAAMAAQG